MHALAQSAQFALTASSSYRMIISQTETELGSVAIRILQEATAEHLLEHSVMLSTERQQPNYRSIEVVVQGSEIIDGDENQTRIRFFVLASAQTSAPFETQAKRQGSLNELIEFSFSRQDRIELFLLRIRVKEAENRDNINTKASSQLQAINTVALFSSVAVSTPAPQSNSTNSSGISPISQRQGLSTLDIVLISVSSFILMGIIWMIFIHHLDRGHFENQRLRALNLQQQQSQDEAAMKQRRNEEKARLHCVDSDLGNTNTTAAVQLTPSTQSSISLGSLRKDDVSRFPTLRASSNSPLTLLSNPPPPSFQISAAQVLSETAALRQQQPDQVYYVTSGLTADRSEAAYPSSCSSECSSSLSHNSSSTGIPAESDSHVTLGIAEPFDQDNWFRRPVTAGREISDDGDGLSSHGSESSSHVFLVGVEKAQSQMSEGSMDPQAMSEWLSSIHVVPESSSTPTKRSAALEVSSLGHVSLEQSMVSSAVASADKRNSSALSL